MTKTSNYPRIGVIIVDEATLKESADFAFENILKCDDESKRSLYVHGYYDGYRRGHVFSKPNGQEAWLIYSVTDGTYESKLIIGDKNDCRKALIHYVHLGPEKYALQDPHTQSILESFDNIDNWGMDQGEWREELEQAYVGVKRIRDLSALNNYPTKQNTEAIK